MAQTRRENARTISSVLLRLARKLFAKVNRNCLTGDAGAEFYNQTLGTDRWHKASRDQNPQGECEQNGNREQRFSCFRFSDPCVHGRAR